MSGSKSQSNNDTRAQVVFTLTILLISGGCAKNLAIKKGDFKLSL